MEPERRARRKTEPARVTRRAQIILLIVEAIGFNGRRWFRS
ncbi:glycoside hydrolase family protein [Streptosporangium soli]